MVNVETFSDGNNGKTAIDRAIKEGEYRGYVKETLRGITVELDKFDKKLNEIDDRLRNVEMKLAAQAVIYGLVSGMISGGIVAWVVLLIKGTGG